jgi:hypothetical protein
VRIITPPGGDGPLAATGDGPAPEQGEAMLGGAAVAGLAGMGLALGGAGGASSGVGYPAAAVGAGVVAGALLSEAFGEIQDLSLPDPAKHLYHQRLRDGATVLAVRTSAEHHDAVIEALARHNAGDVHTAGA